MRQGTKPTLSNFDKLYFKEISSLKNSFSYEWEMHWTI